MVCFCLILLLFWGKWSWTHNPSEFWLIGSNPVGHPALYYGVFITVYGPSITMYPTFNYSLSLQCLVSCIPHSSLPHLSIATATHSSQSPVPGSCSLLGPTRMWTGSTSCEQKNHKVKLFETCFNMLTCYFVNIFKGESQIKWLVKPKP